MKKNSFLKNVGFLLFSQGIIKIIGIIYKLYLTNKTGYADTGNAIFGAAFQVYAIFLTVSSIGVPNAIATLISSRFAVGDSNGAYRVLKIAICIFGAIGFIASCILYIFANTIARIYLEMPETALVLKTLAPSIFIVSITSVLKGYFNGKGKINITAKSLSIEQMSKTFIIIIVIEILSYISNKNTIIMVCGVGITTTLGNVVSLLYIYYKYLKNRKEIWADIITSKTYKKERKINIMREIFKVAFPIAICALMGSVNKTIDAFTIVRIAKKYLVEAEAVKQYGILSGKVESLITLPFSFNMAFTTTLIPTIAEYKAKGEYDRTKQMLKFTILAGILIAIPYFIIIYVFPSQILQLLFPNAPTGELMLKYSSICIIIAIIIQTINSYMQGTNKMGISILSVGISSIIKLILNIILISNRKIGIYGAIISNIISYLLTLVILIYYIIRKEKIKFEITKFLIKLGILMSFMYIICKSIYKMNIYSSNLIKMILSIFIGGIIYIIMTWVIKIFSKEDIKLITKK